MRRLAIAAVLLICVFALSGCEKPDTAKPQDMGDFTLHDIAGNEVSLKAYRGKVVLLEFWATWCPPCRISVPELKQLHKNMEGEDFIILAIAIDDTIRKVKRFVEENGIEYTVLMDNKGIDDLYRVHTIPTTILLDKEGKVAHTQRGYAPGMFEEIEKDIRELL